MATGVSRARTLGLAAEMSFWVFLALVPLAAVAGFAAARVATSHDWLGSSLLASVPASAHALVNQQVEQVAAWRGSTVAPLAALTFLWLASSGVHAVFDALQVQAGVARPWWKNRLLAIAACVALSVGVAVLALLATGIGWIETLAGRVVPQAVARSEWTAAGRALRAVLAAAVAVAMVAGLYRVGIPRAACAHRALLPGALLAVVLQAALAWGYGFYVAKFGSSGAYQAGLAVIGVTMMTLWLSGVALLLGAELNRVVGRQRTRSDAPRGGPLAGELRSSGRS
jgi:membrane protein